MFHSVDIHLTHNFCCVSCLFFFQLSQPHNLRFMKCLQHVQSYVRWNPLLNTQICWTAQKTAWYPRTYNIEPLNVEKPPEWNRQSSLWPVSSWWMAMTQKCSCLRVLQAGRVQFHTLKCLLGENTTQKARNRVLNTLSNSHHGASPPPPFFCLAFSSPLSAPLLLHFSL